MNGHAGGLEGYTDIVEIKFVQQPDVFEGGLHHGLGADAAVFGQNGLLQRSESRSTWAASSWAVDSGIPGAAQLAEPVRRLHDIGHAQPSLLYGLFRKEISPKYEGYVHLAGLAALMCLMLVVTLSDVGKLFGK